MQNVHIANLDLNLLRVFDAVFEEGGVTRAGARLGLTPVGGQPRAQPSALFPRRRAVRARPRRHAADAAGLVPGTAGADGAGAAHGGPGDGGLRAGGQRAAVHHRRGGLRLHPVRSAAGGAGGACGAPRRPAVRRDAGGPGRAARFRGPGLRHRGLRERAAAFRPRPAAGRDRGLGGPRRPSAGRPAAQPGGPLGGATRPGRRTRARDGGPHATPSPGAPAGRISGRSKTPWRRAACGGRWG